MGAAPSHDDALDRCSAHPARFPRTLINAVFQLEKSSHTLRIDVIGDRGSPKPNCMLQDFPQCESQPLQFHAGQPPGAPSGTKTRPKQALIGVDVPHPRQQRLIQQCRLDPQTPSPKKRRKLITLNVQRFRPRGPKTFPTRQIAKFQPPKPPRVHKTHLAAGGHGQTRMRVGGNRGIRSRHKQPSRHAKVDNPLRLRRLHTRRPRSSSSLLPSSKIANNVLPDAFHSQNNSPFKPSQLLARRCFERLLVRAKPSRENTIAAHPRIHSARDRLHLGKFRHLLYFSQMASR